MCSDSCGLHEDRDPESDANGVREDNRNASMPIGAGLLGSARVICCDSADDAAKVLCSDGCVATLVNRPRAEEVQRMCFEYVATRPRWPDTHELNPLEATHDRVAVIDFSRVSQDCTLTGPCLEGATGYGNNLPPRNSADVASASAAIAEVL